MALGIVAASVLEMRVAHAELGGALVHALHELALVTGECIGQRVAGVVGRGHQCGGEQILQNIAFARLEFDAGTGFAGGGGRDADFTRQVALFDHQQGGHQFGQAGGGQAFMRLAFPGRRAVDLHPVGGRHVGEQIGQGGGQRNVAQQPQPDQVAHAQKPNIPFSFFAPSMAPPTGLSVTMSDERGELV